jgi:hypothetical protein
MLAAIARRQILACVLVAALPLALRWVALSSHPVPDPIWDDEYSYLLGADTLASGRLANPPHPMWVHFETFHVNWLPTYVTKFPPGQPLMLALGQKLLGHPWYGVWISFGLMSAALCWMLQGWMPPVFAMLGAFIGVAQLGIFRYWMDSYCGGAVPAMGGCLVLGAAVRLARGANWRTATLGAVGLMILANSRPFEGLATSVGALIFLWISRRARGSLTGLLRRNVILPAAAVCIAGFAWIGYYNYRTTGSPRIFSYEVNHKTYGANPQFWFLPDWSPPDYRHAEIRKVWAGWTHDYWARAHRNPLVVLPRFLRAASFFFMPLLVFAGLAGLLLSRSGKVWAALAILALLCGFLLLEVDVSPHYFSPAIFLSLVPVLYGVRWLRVAGRRFGPALVLLFAVMIGAKAGRPDIYHDPSTAPSRAQVVRSLTARGGRHVVFVRYAPEHDTSVIDLVYNCADIDGSPIVWARYMGEAADRELIQYYPDRNAWILDADASPMQLRPYASSAN